MLIKDTLRGLELKEKLNSLYGNSLVSEILYYLSSWGRAWIVGGAARDLYTGNIPRDLDIVVEMDSRKLMSKVTNKFSSVTKAKVINKGRYVGVNEAEKHVPTPISDVYHNDKESFVRYDNILEKSVYTFKSTWELTIGDQKLDIWALEDSFNDCKTLETLLDSFPFCHDAISMNLETGDILKHELFDNSFELGLIFPLCLDNISRAVNVHMARALNTHFKYGFEFSKEMKKLVASYDLIPTSYEKIALQFLTRYSKDLSPTQIEKLITQLCSLELEDYLNF